ncbi:hypothetical protein OKW28_005483 [Paraburkholderia sp. 40]
MRGVDFDLADHARLRERDDRPVVARLATTTRFPAVAHIHAATRHQQRRGRAEVLVVRADQIRAVFHRREIELLGAARAGPVDLRLTVNTQTRDAAVRIDVHAQMRVRARVADFEVVVAIALQRGRRHDLGPLRRLIRLAIHNARRFHRRRRREVAGEVARVEVESLDHAGPRELDDAPVVAGRALAARFPAVHPLAVVVVLARNEDGRFRIQHAVLRREEFVASLERLRAQTRVRQVHVTAREFRCVGVENRKCHLCRP